MQPIHGPRARSAALAAGLFLIGAAGLVPASALAQDAASLCTGDVMRLCSQYIPDERQITRCLTSKRSSLSPACRAVFAKPKKSSRKKS
jgi:hypothetical protein